MSPIAHVARSASAGLRGTTAPLHRPTPIAMLWSRRSLFIVALLLVADVVIAFSLVQAWQDRYGSGADQTRQLRMGQGTVSAPAVRTATATGSVTTLASAQR
jgi:hypothetical protein